MNTGEYTMQKPSLITNIYDNRATDHPTLDCMTFVLNEVDGPNGELACLGTSYNGVSVSQFSRCDDGPHLGERVEWNDLSDELKRHVISRLK